MPTSLLMKKLRCAAVVRNTPLVFKFYFSVSQWETVRGDRLFLENDAFKNFLHVGIVKTLSRNLDINATYTTLERSDETVV